MSQYYIFDMSEDGPSRLEGSKSYNTYHQAKNKIKELCRKRPSARLAIMQKQAEFWLDPNPEVLSTEPSEAKSDD